MRKNPKNLAAIFRYIKPDAGKDEVIQSSEAERQAVYTWLFKTSRKNKQDVRIRSLLEVEVFSNIFSEWKRLKYPFNSLVPSYATAIGSSADRPDSLAELVGIVLNKGRWYPTIQIQGLFFGEKTPYETRLTYQKSQGEQKMPPEVAETLHQALLGVVENGTAQRIRSAFLLSDGTCLAVGGKNGILSHIRLCLCRCR